ncbi:MAG TPA: zinc-dependent metalloprotease family protein [Ferruginibacter sp.]|mgnify:FL=1|nr:zinc-dependent metalloprotease family protein [Ferruginibacter sp.]HRO06940.1 zinc-dependent metalloprotease family protein [Ferruginibacter sp.]HRO95737.1 zinc-dependent metalloprotease family protein [Ferruginibacter sp.]HRP49254.1 zinc-dependent metalloprotease family protein [Ferruginibacter sp.]
MRKVYQKLWAMFIFTLAVTPVFAQNFFFTDASESKIQYNPAQRVIQPQKARVTELNVQAMQRFLQTLPEEFSIRENRNVAPVMEIPMPDGTIAQFRVWESVIMEEGLANKYPEIRTYAGQGITDPAANIRFSMDPYFGFHAQILSPNGTVYIDPYARGNVQFYQSYFKANHYRVTNNVCLVEDDQHVPVSNATNAGPCRGAQLFTYRFAVACTGEYAIAATGLGSPTVAQTLARIVTTVNRVTGVYEKEVAVRLILIANNDQIVFTNPSTDPFNGNNNAGVLIGESQSVINLNIGSANYDIGHTFSTGGGGLAGFGVVCSNSNKARGITGSNNPTGDGYDIDFVAHEVGHQFGGSHSFNSSTSSCGGGNRNGSTAYEVGAGTTIMAYAGLCGTDNIQNASDPYFHSISFDQISTFITAGGGSSCRQSIATGNTLPVIDPLTNNNVSIPLGTPFTLSGTATDADGDALTYSWEHWDLGPSTTWSGGAGNGLSPLFKARVPKTTGVRNFPDMAVILANYPVNPPATMGGLKGETLSTVARNMKFRLTVRDNRAGGGSVVSAGDGCQITSVYQISVVAGTGPFVVTVPNGGESYPGGSSQTITWNVAGTNNAPISAANVRITMSTDGGQTYPHLITNSTPNDGSELLTIPVVTPTSTARVKIEGVDNVFFDISNNNFSITAAVAPTFDLGTPAPVAVTCGGASTATATLSTTAINGFNTPITLTASGAPAGTNVTFSANPVTPGNSTNVTLNGVNTLSNGTYTITVTATGGSIVRTRDISFVVSGGSAPVITTQPSSVSGCVGSLASFTVAGTNVTTYQWQVSTDGGTTFTNIAGANAATYVIASTTGAQNGNNYRVILSNACNSVTSNAVTLGALTGPVFTTQPANADGCNGGTATITAAVSAPSTLQWQMSTDGGATWNNITGATSATLSLTGLTTAMSSNQYRLVATNICGTSNSNASTLTVNTVATINTQPTDVNICSGLNASFTVAATGTGIAYQWQVSTDGGTTWNDISGATSGTLSLNNVAQSLDGNRYRALVTSTCTPTGTLSNSATLTVFTPVTITAQPASTNTCIDDDATFSVTATGSGLSYQWEVSTNGGATFTPIAGATGASLVVPNVTPGISGNQYRVVVTGVPCGVATSDAATLNVNPVPAVTVSGTGVTALYPGLTTTLTANVVPGPASAYQWFFNGSPIPNATSATYLVTSQGLGTYTVTATAANGCVGESTNSIAIGDSAIDQMFIYPSPNAGQFNVSYYSVNGLNTTNFNTEAVLNIFDAKGSRVYTKRYTVLAPYQEMKVDLRNMGKGIYWVELTDRNGRRIKTGKVAIL